MHTKTNSTRQSTSLYTHVDHSDTTVGFLWHLSLHKGSGKTKQNSCKQPYKTSTRSHTRCIVNQFDSFDALPLKTEPQNSCGMMARRVECFLTLPISPKMPPRGCLYATLLQCLTHTNRLCRESASSLSLISF